MIRRSTVRHQQRQKRLQGEVWEAVSGSGASLVAQMVRNLLAMQEIRVPSLGREDPLEKEMTTHSSIFTWKIPWAEEPAW